MVSNGTIVYVKEISPSNNGATVMAPSVHTNTKSYAVSSLTALFATYLPTKKTTIPTTTVLMIYPYSEISFITPKTLNINFLLWTYI